MTTFLRNHFVWTILMFATVFFPTGASAFAITDLYELLTRKAPENEPKDTPVESYTVLAPGTGGLGSIVCPMCTDQMILYGSISGAVLYKNFNLALRLVEIKIMIHAVSLNYRLH